MSFHLAVYWHGVAAETSDGVAMRSAFGPYVELLAESVERLTLVAHDPPKSPERGEQLADYTARPSRGNIDVLSLGPLGGRRDYLARARRVAQVVGSASESWDVLLLRFGRRANLVLEANRCPRVVSLVWGSQGQMGLRSALRVLSPGRAVYVLRSEWHLRRTLRSSGLAFTDGEACQARYSRFVPTGRIGLLRSSSRRSRFSYRVSDRLTSPVARFLYVGHVTEQKGIFDTIEAFRLIREGSFPQATLHVAGIGTDLNEARRRVSAAGLDEAVVFHGWVPAGEKLFDLYRNSDVLLFLSRSSTESLPRVVSEAWAHSVLVVSTPVGSLPIAYRDGRELLFAPISDPPAAAGAVDRLRSDAALRHDMMDSGYERAKEATLEAVTDDLLEEMTEHWPELVGDREGSNGSR